MLPEHDAASTTAVKENEPLLEFRGASHAKRYEIVNGLPIHARQAKPSIDVQTSND